MNKSIAAASLIFAFALSYTVSMPQAVELNKSPDDNSAYIITDVTHTLFNTYTEYDPNTKATRHYITADCPVSFPHATQVHIKVTPASAEYIFSPTPTVDNHYFYSSDVDKVTKVEIIFDTNLKCKVVYIGI